MAVAAAVQPYVKSGSNCRAVILADVQVLMPVLLLAAGLALPAAARAGTNQDTSRARLEALRDALAFSTLHDPLRS